MNSRICHSGICLLATSTLCGCLYFVDDAPIVDAAPADMAQPVAPPADLSVEDMQSQTCPSETRGKSCWDFRKGQFDPKYGMAWQSSPALSWRFPAGEMASLGSLTNDPISAGMSAVTVAVISPVIAIGNPRVTAVTLRVEQKLTARKESNAQILESFSDPNTLHSFTIKARYGFFEKDWVKPPGNKVQFQFSLTAYAGSSVPAGDWQIERVEVIPLCGQTQCSF